MSDLMRTEEPSLRKHTELAYRIGKVQGLMEARRLHRFHGEGWERELMATCWRELGEVDDEVVARFAADVAGVGSVADVCGGDTASTPEPTV